MKYIPIITIAIALILLFILGWIAKRFFSKRKAKNKILAELRKAQLSEIEKEFNKAEQMITNDPSRKPEEILFELAMKGNNRRINNGNTTTNTSTSANQQASTQDYNSTAATSSASSSQSSSSTSEGDAGENRAIGDRLGGEAQAASFIGTSSSDIPGTGQPFQGGSIQAQASVIAKPVKRKRKINWAKFD